MHAAKRKKGEETDGMVSAGDAGRIKR